MKIYTLSRPDSYWYNIPRDVIEPIYISQIPYSLQLELNIRHHSIVVFNQKGNRTFLRVSGKIIDGKRAEKIIKILNGYMKTQQIYGGRRIR